MLAPGCATIVEYNPVGQDELYGKNVLILESSYAPPLPQSILASVQNHFEEELHRMPHLGTVISRREFRAINQGDRQILQDYAVLSDSLSIVGLTDREITVRLRESQNVDLLAMVQVLQLPCEFCEQESRLGLIAILLDTASGELRWRAHLSEEIELDTPSRELAEIADELSDELIGMLEVLLEPKWHLLRFDNLRKPTT